MTTPQILDQNSTTHEGCVIYKIVREFHVHFDCGVLLANSHRLDTPFIESETMIVDSTKWKIRAYPNGLNGNSEYVQFILLWETDRDMEADVKLILLTKKSSSVSLFTNRQMTIKKGIKEDIGVSSLSKASMNSGSGSELIINNQYQFTLSVGLNTTPNLSTTTFVDFSKTFSERLFHKATSDVDIVVEGTRIPAHKLILSLASPVFTAMFENQMQESVNNEIVISDFSEEVVRSMLRCIYDWSSVESEVERNPEQLLCIANKYELTAIEGIASNHIIDTINEDNVIDTLHSANQFDRVRIKAAAMSYITVNAESLLIDLDFQRNLRNCVGCDLMVELLTYVATNKRAK